MHVFIPNSNAVCTVRVHSFPIRLISFRIHYNIYLFILFIARLVNMSTGSVFFYVHFKMYVKKRWKLFLTTRFFFQSQWKMALIVTSLPACRDFFRLRTDLIHLWCTLKSVEISKINLDIVFFFLSIFFKWPNFVVDRIREPGICK